MKYLLGVDFGGGSSKATLIDENGKAVCTASCEYPMLFPDIGWTEQNPEDLYGAFVTNIRTIFDRSGVRPEEIEAVSLDGGTHIAVLLDGEMQVIRPAIYWSDIRSADQAKRLGDRYGKEIRELGYNNVGALWTLPQLLWLKETEPENHRRIRHILFLKDYIRYRITDVLATDSIEAMGALMMDAGKNEWSEWLCGLCGISVEQMPSIVEPDAVIGTVTPKAARETGLSERTKVIAGATDTVMEVYASGAIRPGQATIKLATAGRVCPITDHAVVDPLLVTYRHIIPGLWYPGTATKACASSLRWYRDILCGQEMEAEAKTGKPAYAAMDEAASQVPAGCSGMFFHPYLQGEITPYSDTKLRASFTGVTSMHTKAHFTRAVMEGVAFSLKQSVQVLEGLDIRFTEPLRIIGGGAKSQLWRQIVADVLGMPLQRMHSDDSSIGSAMLAGVATGIFSSYEDSVNKCSRTGEMVFPKEENREVYEKNFVIYAKIAEALKDIYHLL